MESAPKQTHAYRLIRTTFRNRIQWEDGPGSFENIVSDISKRVVRIWVGFVPYDLNLYIYPDEDDGWIEYRHHIEERVQGTGPWKYLREVRYDPKLDHDFDDDF